MLFLCTGNYYRSRFAEAFFNHHSAAHGLHWRAVSRGLAIEYGVNNVGPLSADTAARLTELSISHDQHLRVPAQVTEEELRQADLIIAVKEAEHRPLLRERFPGWEGRAEYWQVHDVDYATPQEALPALERHVLALVMRLLDEERAQDAGAA